MWTTGKILLITAGLGVTYVVFAAGAMRIALRSQEVSVPDLVGRDVTEATTLLETVGLGLRVQQGRRPDATVAAGSIMQQEPPANVTARRQRTVKVWVSAGPQASIVPALVGQSAELATSRLRGGVLQPRSIV